MFRLYDTINKNTKIVENNILLNQDDNCENDEYIDRDFENNNITNQDIFDENVDKLPRKTDIRKFLNERDDDNDTNNIIDNDKLDDEVYYNREDLKNYKEDADDENEDFQENKYDSEIDINLDYDESNDLYQESNHYSLGI